MNFSEFATGLFPFCSGHLGKEQYFNEIIGNFIQDSAMDSCPILEKKPDTKYRYLSGKRVIPLKEAKYIYNHRDKKKLSQWIATQTDEFDSYDGVVGWLKSNGINDTYADDACADLFEQILCDIVSSSKNKRSLKPPISKLLSGRDLEHLDKFMNDFNEILKFCISTDPTIEPMPLELPTQFDMLYEMWKYRDTDFKNAKLNSLKYDIINNLYDYFSYWGLLMSYDTVSGYCVYKKPLYPRSEEVKKSHQKKMLAFRKIFANLHENLCEFVNNADLPIQ